MQASFPIMPYDAAVMSAARSSTRLRQIREAAGLSLRELARQLGEDHSNVGFWERTGTPPRSNVLVPMAAALGVTVEELLGHEKPKRAAAPGGKVRSVFERVQKLPRRQQDKIVEVVEALLKAS
jgi:transcriptional regulator with XRE-family HTH domain